MINLNPDIKKKVKRTFPKSRIALIMVSVISFIIIVAISIHVYFGLIKNYREQGLEFIDLSSGIFDDNSDNSI